MNSKFLGNKVLVTMEDGTSHETFVAVCDYDGVTLKDTETEKDIICLNRAEYANSNRVSYSTMFAVTITEIKKGIAEYQKDPMRQFPDADLGSMSCSVGG